MINFVWDIGIPVLPLSDTGYFHGACFRENFRNVIILKQKNQSTSRWLFDLCHELFHTFLQKDEKNLMTISNETINNFNAKNELNCNEFAASILFNGKQEELTQLSVKLANGNIRFLKKAVKIVAKEKQINEGILANYLAYRLTQQNINWWGTAENIQKADKNAFEIARDIFINRVDTNKINILDKELLMQALHLY